MDQRAPLPPVDDHDRRLLSHVHPSDWRNPEPSSTYDLAVIGGGTAGLVCAAGAAGLGARVALVERSLLGGDCLNSGCVPSKALLRSARAVLAAREAARVGVETSASVNFSAVMGRLRERRADIAPHDSAVRLRNLGVDLYFGEGLFNGPRTLMVEGRTVRFRRAVIATGGRPVIPEVFRGKPEATSSTPHATARAPRVLTTDTVFSLTEQPRELLVVGGGSTGCELAQAFALLGTRVTLVESQSRVLPAEDPDASALVLRRLRADGVTVIVDARLDDIDTSRFDAVLMAVGRTPNVEGLNLGAAGVERDGGGITVDRYLATTNRRIYAAGDVCSRYKFTHAADAMARVVVQNALFGWRRPADTLVIPWCTYTFPEVAHVGATAANAARSGATAVTIRFDGVDRAVVDEETDGFVRIHHQRGRVVAATIVAAHAGELIGYVASIMRRKRALGDLSAEIFPYPTLAEALRQAGDTYRRSRLTASARRLVQRYLAVRRLFV